MRYLAAALDPRIGDHLQTPEPPDAPARCRSRASRDRRGHDRQRPDGQVAHDGVSQRRGRLRHHPLQPRFEILADAKEDLARSGAESLGYARWTTDWREAVTDPRVDVVDIVTPNFLHHEIAMAAIAAGKHVYCEKPLALNAADAKEMYEAAEKAGVKTLVGFNYLRNPAIAEARRLISERCARRDLERSRVDSSSTPAAIRTCRSPGGSSAPLAGSGALGDLGAHIISLAQVLVGPISSVVGLSRTFIPSRPEPTGAFGYGSGADLNAPRHDVENDDATTFLMEFASGASGHIEASRVATGSSWRLSLEVIGSLGALQFVQQDIHTLRLYLSGDPDERKGYREIEMGPAHGDYGVFWPLRRGSARRTRVEDDRGARAAERHRGGPTTRRRLRRGMASLRSAGRAVRFTARLARLVVPRRPSRRHRKPHGRPSETRRESRSVRVRPTDPSTHRAGVPP